MNPQEQFPISLTEVIRAKTPVYQHFLPSQLTSYAGLSSLLDMQIYIKHENHNPTGSFKVRGGINLMHHLREAGVSGVVTFSTGNHGISVATTASWFGLSAVVVVPKGNNSAKNRKIREAGAELIEAGTTFEESSKAVEAIVEERGLYYVHPANEPHLINGVGTEFLEIVESLPDVDAVIIPIGAGSEAAAAVTVLKTISPQIEIYAVQAKNSCAAYLSWKQGSIQTSENKTFAGGFATGSGYEMPFEIYKDQLEDFVLLSESEIYEGIALAAYYTQNFVEGAGASTLMAAMKLKEQLKGKKVVLQFSGANASSEEIEKAYKLTAFKDGQFSI